ncbi:arylamine N-acetyltransferase [Candidatus Amarobacter glycogenicus]|uniref:arylamine N-acetyltransferase family protein n=1 Tax=Candidatus Amarobacter glycogenicus TaxID=3140699 RepID=UPI002A120BD0|nr:arylamine N-acetyltransferase [Dehalococcoidia bacterium]
MPAPLLPAYLQRIGYEGPVAPTVETLQGMHRAHFLHVPFENLDIQRGVPIVVDLDHNYDKIVTRGRGGFCLELTSLFAWALREIGFKVDILGGRVLAASGQLGEPLSHMALAVYLDEPWLADVGFGGRVAQPLRLSERGPQTSGASTYTVANDGDHWLVTCLDPWLALQAPRTYVLTLQPRELGEFAGVCHWLQTSPDSAFTRGDVVSLSTDHGRLSYSPGRLTIASGDTREEREVAPEGVGPALSEHFGIVL